MDATPAMDVSKKERKRRYDRERYRASSKYKHNILTLPSSDDEEKDCHKKPKTSTRKTSGQPRKKNAGVQPSAVQSKQEVAGNSVIDAEINALWQECLAEIQNNSNESVQNPRSNAEC